MKYIHKVSESYEDSSVDSSPLPPCEETCKLGFCEDMTGSGDVREKGFKSKNNQKFDISHHHNHSFTDL